MHPYEQIVDILNKVASGEASVADALDEIDSTVIRPKNGPKWDYISPGIFATLASVARNRNP